MGAQAVVSVAGQYPKAMGKARWLGLSWGSWLRPGHALPVRQTAQECL